MYKKILVPLDGSELAEQVLPHVALLAEGLGARVQLVRIFDHVPPSLADPAHRLYLDQVALSYRNEAKDSLEKAAASLEAKGVSVDIEVHEADDASGVASYVVSAAESKPDTLTAMTTHGRSGLGRWLLGSISDKVLHAIKSPLFLVRSRKESEFSADVKLETVILPLDGSPLAEQTIPHAAPIAAKLGLNVILISVTPPTYQAVFGDPAIIREPAGEPDPRAAGYLADVAERLRKEGVANVQERPLYGPPAEVILDVARETPNSFVAMTTHGRTGVGRWLLGSVADRAVRYSGGPVLLNRASGG